MAARLLLTSAGNAASNNIVRSLRAAGEPVFIVGCHDDRFVLSGSSADKKYLVPHVDHPQWTRALQHVLETEALRLIIPTVDVDVAALCYAARNRLADYLFLPRRSVIETCQDKYHLSAFLRTRGVDVPETRPIGDLRSIAATFRQFGDRRPLWCRVRTGTGSLGALPVRTPEQARNWISYWGEMRGSQRVHSFFPNICRGATSGARASGGTANLS